MKRDTEAEELTRLHAITIRLPWEKGKRSWCKFQRTRDLWFEHIRALDRRNYYEHSTLNAVTNLGRPHPRPGGGWARCILPALTPSAGEHHVSGGEFKGGVEPGGPCLHILLACRSKPKMAALNFCRPFQDSSIVASISREVQGGRGVESASPERLRDNVGKGPSLSLRRPSGSNLHLSTILASFILRTFWCHTQEYLKI
jgi:hypothetical protein